MIAQQKFIDVVSKLTEDDFKEAQDLIETIRKLINDKYSDEVTIAVLVSKFK